MSNRKNGLGATRLSGTFRAGFAVLSGALTVALTAAGLGAASPASATAVTTAAVQCGDVVTANVVLTADLVCSGTGLTIGADNVTVNLAGRTVSGAPAVSVPDRRDTKIVNGTLAGSQAVVAAGSQLTSPIPLTISRVRLQAATRLTNTTAVIGQALGGCVVTGLRAQDSTVTIDRCEVRESLHLRQSTGTVRASKLISGGLGLEHSFGGRYEDNVFDDFGVSVYELSRDNVFIRNVMKNADSAFSFSMPQLPGNSNTIQDNDIRNNDIGVEAKDVVGLTIKGNRFTGNRTAGVFIDNKLNFYGVQDWISDNLFTGNGKQPSGINDRDGNPVRGGVHVRTISASRINLARNTGRLNGGYLIWAPADQVVDGGGNKGPCGPVPNPDLTCS